MSSSAGTARQNKFVLIYIVELSKPYRMVFESWESVQAKQIVPLFTRVYFFHVCETHAAKQLPRSSWTSPGYKSNTTEQQKSSSFCWSLLGIVEMKCTKDRACRNKGCKQEVNYTLECGHVWTSWICNNWTACLTAGILKNNTANTLVLRGQQSYWKLQETGTYLLMETVH